MPKRNHIIVVAVGGAILVVLGLLSYRPAVAPQPPVEGETVATTTVEVDTTPTPVPQRGLPPEPTFVLPDGATPIDDYVFTYDGDVFVRSLTSPQPLAIPDADVATFQSLTNFMGSFDLNAVSICGATGNYKFYGDDDNLYFYQYWRTPEFRASKFERIADGDPIAFKKISDTTFTDGARTFTVSLQKATTTCAYTLIKK